MRVLIHFNNTVSTLELYVVIMHVTHTLKMFSVLHTTGSYICLSTAFQLYFQFIDVG